MEISLDKVKIAEINKRCERKLSTGVVYSLKLCLRSSGSDILTISSSPACQLKYRLSSVFFYHIQDYLCRFLEISLSKNTILLADSHMDIFFVMKQ
jgi:hypothetical protein